MTRPKDFTTRETLTAATMIVLIVVMVVIAVTRYIAPFL